jgi:hypothetical protein
VTLAGTSKPATYHVILSDVVARSVTMFVKASVRAKSKDLTHQRV